MVSIIIPYNKDRGYLTHALNSIDRQGYKDIEVIQSHSDNGVSYNLNQGIKKAKGELITYLCDDDMLPPNAIEDTVKNFKGDFVHGNAVNFWPDGKKQLQVPTKLNPTLKDMLNKNFIHGGTVTYHIDCFSDNNLFDESLTTGEEYEFNLRLLSQGYKLEYVDKLLYLYRRHEAQKSLGNQASEYIAERKRKINLIKGMYR